MCTAVARGAAARCVPSLRLALLPRARSLPEGAVVRDGPHLYRFTGQQLRALANTMRRVGLMLWQQVRPGLRLACLTPVSRGLAMSRRPVTGLSGSAPLLPWLPAGAAVPTAHFQARHAAPGRAGQPAGGEGAGRGLRACSAGAARPAARGRRHGTDVLGCALARKLPGLAPTHALPLASPRSKTWTTGVASCGSCTAAQSSCTPSWRGTDATWSACGR